MKELQTEQIKSIANGILQFIKKICDENGIGFFLAYGTCLGAVRHNGFIPWDDDIDIFMKREDFERFARVMGSRDTTPYKLLYLNEENYTLPLPKVIDTRTELHQLNQREYVPLGVYVDVFILDSLPTDDTTREHYFQKLYHTQTRWHWFQIKRDYTDRTGLKTFFAKALYNHISPRRFAVKLDKISKKYNNKNQTWYIGEMTYVSGNRNKSCYLAEWFEHTIPVMFEGVEYRIPQKYDDYLTHVYGDWRQLPPEGKRVSHHSFVAYFKA